MMKESIHQKDITTLNVHTLNKWTQKHTKEKQTNPEACGRL